MLFADSNLRIWGNASKKDVFGDICYALSPSVASNNIENRKHFNGVEIGNA